MILLRVSHWPRRLLVMSAFNLADELARACALFSLLFLMLCIVCMKTVYNVVKYICYKWAPLETYIANIVQWAMLTSELVSWFTMPLWLGKISVWSVFSLGRFRFSNAWGHAFLIIWNKTIECGVVGGNSLDFLKGLFLLGHLKSICPENTQWSKAQNYFLFQWTILC